MGIPQEHPQEQNASGGFKIRLKRIGDLGEDFIELSSQDGIQKESKYKKSLSREAAAIQHLFLPKIPTLVEFTASLAEN